MRNPDSGTEPRFGERRRLLIAADQGVIRDDVARVWPETAAIDLRAASLAHALVLLDMQAAPDALIVEIGVADDAAAALLDRCEEMALSHGQRGLILFARPCLDLVAARITAPTLTLLCDPTQAERIAAIGFVIGQGPSRVFETRDTARDGLASLADEVARIAKALATLAGDEARPGGDTFSDGLIGYRADATAKRASGVAVAASEVRALIKARRLREQFFAADLFADPAWDMLLDLCAARIERTPVSVSSLCIAAAVPPTTALRTIRTMTECGLFVRVDDLADRRRVFIELSAAAAVAMQDYVATARTIT